MVVVNWCFVYLDSQCHCNKYNAVNTFTYVIHLSSWYKDVIMYSGTNQTAFVQYHMDAMNNVMAKLLQLYYFVTCTLLLYLLSLSLELFFLLLF